MGAVGRQPHTLTLILFLILNYFCFLKRRFGFLNRRTGSFIVGEIIRSDMGFGGSLFHPLSSMYNEILKYDTRYCL